MAVLDQTAIFFIKLLIPEILIHSLFKDVEGTPKLRYLWQKLFGFFDFIKTEYVVAISITITGTSFVISNQLFKLAIGKTVPQLVASINVISKLLVTLSILVFTVLTLTIYAWDKNWEERHYLMLGASIILFVAGFLIERAGVI